MIRTGGLVDLNERGTHLMLGMLKSLVGVWYMQKFLIITYMGCFELISYLGNIFSVILYFVLKLELTITKMLYINSLIITEFYTVTHSNIIVLIKTKYFLICLSAFYLLSQLKELGVTLFKITPSPFIFKNSASLSFYFYLR